MAKYLKGIKSFDDLKSKYRKLLKKHHPDNGGDLETMKEVNVEYDALFAVWKSRREKETGETINETAEGTRRQFYTANGWAGDNYDSKLTLKEIAKIVRTYVKEKYPTCKFSVRTSYGSMCQSLRVELKEFPSKMHKTSDDLRNEGLTEHIVTTDWKGNPIEYDEYREEINDLLRRLRYNNLFDLDSWYPDDLIRAYERACEKSDFYAIQTEYFKSVIADVNSFVESYNYRDCDGQIDYFDVNFWFHGVNTDYCKQVTKTARISKPKEELQPV